MKKYGSLVALAVVAILAAVFFGTRQKPVEKVKAPYSIAKVENLARIELTRPGDELVVLEKADAAWKMTKPVDAPLAESVIKEIDAAFDKAINTDDITLSAEKLAEFELDEPNAVKVALFTQGASAPSAEFHAGKTIAVPETRAKRTFVKTADGKVFRAHTDIGESLRKDVDSLRSRQVQKFDRDAIDEVKINYQDGTSILVKRGEDQWILGQPDVKMTLEGSQASALASNFANLVASGFVEGKTPAEVGLEPPHATVIAKVNGDPKRLLVSAPVEGEKKFYVKTSNSDHIYEISDTTGKALTPTLLSLRNRLVLDLKKDDITRMEFDGEDRVVVEKNDGKWEFVRPKKGPVKQTALDSKLATFAQLRAIRFEEKSDAEAGLDKPDATLSLTVDGKSHTLLIGTKADAKGNLYAKWKDSDHVMVVPQWIKDRAETKAGELSEDES